MNSLARLIDHGPAPGCWNMAVDDALLLSAVASGCVILRFYQWSEPTLSLGYFQKQEDRALHTASLDASWLRRASGGGAILHHHELTYSLAWPVKDHLSKQSQEIVKVAHQALIAALSDWGIAARLVGEGNESDSKNSPFLCFQRRSQEDVVLNGVKIQGSAQRRHRGGVLQHGSLLLAKSQKAPELLGLNELADREIPLDEIKAKWGTGLADALQLTWQEGELTAAESGEAERIEQSRYSLPEWNCRR